MKRWPAFLLLPLVTLAARPAPAQVHVAATLGPDETWSAEAGPYLVEVDVTVPDGSRLTIGPGVQVILSAGRSLDVQGELVARGTDAAPIVFAGRDAGDGTTDRWGSIVFEDSSKDAEFQDRDLLIFRTTADELYVLHRRRDGQMELVEIP